MAMVSNNQSNGASIFSDLQSLNGIRKQATVDSRGAIKAAAKEFEAFFMNMMLKSMRQASEIMGGDSLFGSQQEKMFIGMLDEQMSVELSQKGDLGIADLMARNLLGDNKPAVNSQSSVRQELALGKTTRAMGYQKDLLMKQGEIFTPVNHPVKSVDEIQVEHLLSENKKRTVQPLAVMDEAQRSAPGKVEKKSLFDDAKSFINQLLPYATKIAEKIGVDPKLLIAQAALETGWGKYIMHDSHGRPSNNLFGIKSSSQWQGPSVRIDTLEVDNGEFVKTKDDFRMYESFEKSFDDYVDFLQSNPRYQGALKVVKDAKQFVQSLQSAGYATDPDYAKKILRIFNTGMTQVRSPSAD